MKKDLERIKKYYGEQMMHFCRSFFPQILEKENLLPMILEIHFPHSKFLIKDIIQNNKLDEFKNYIFSIYNIEKEVVVSENEKSALELMDEAGYILYPECKTEADIQYFRKYWEPSELLCTFDGGRLESCRVWFAIKKNIDDIKRENFDNPTRQDEYGTSAISIQFSNTENQTLSIKNRYNHKVDNPDNTFFSNLENIISGLTYAFEKDFGVRDRTVKSTFELDNYIAINGKYYHYNYEINNIYYCDNNVIIDNYEVKHLPQNQILVDYFIFDNTTKQVYLYDENLKDSFVDTFGEIENMSYSSKGEICVKVKNGKDIKIGLDERHRMILYDNENVTQIGNNFLAYNQVLSYLSMNNLRKCENDFCKFNRNLQQVDLSSLEKCGDNFFKSNQILSQISLPKLIECGDDFLSDNTDLNNLYLPNLKTCKNSFLHQNVNLKKIDLPNLEICRNDFLHRDLALEELCLPNLKVCGNGFLADNSVLNKIDLPNLQECGHNFLYSNKNLEKLDLKSLQTCGVDFLYCNEDLSDLNLPNLQECGSLFLLNNNNLANINLPNLKNCGNGFLRNNSKINIINLPNLEQCGDNFLEYVNNVNELSLDKLEKCGSYFLFCNQSIKKLHLPSLEKCGKLFLASNNNMEEVCMPNLSDEDLKSMYNKKIKELLKTKHPIIDFLDKIMGR